MEEEEEEGRKKSDPTSFKRKHSLKGKQLLPVIRKLRDIQDDHGIKQLAKGLLLQGVPKICMRMY